MSHGGLEVELFQEYEVKLHLITFTGRSLKPAENNMSNCGSMKLKLVALRWTT